MDASVEDANTEDTNSDDAGMCTPIELGEWALDNFDDVSIRYRALITPDVQGVPWVFYLEFNRYDTEYTGTFPLGGDGPDANYGTCAHCVVAFYGLDFTHAFIATGGTLTLTGDPFTMMLNGTLDDVVLQEVTIEGDDLHSVPVPDGECLHLADVSLRQRFAPVGWHCSVDAFADGETCNCACGAYDDDCYNSDLPIDGCSTDQRCVGRLNSGGVDPVCVNSCSRADGDACPDAEVCFDDVNGDLCEGDEDLIDRAVALGEACEADAHYCAIDDDGFVNGYCDVFVRNDSICRPRCESNDECDALAFEECYTISATAGFCAPRYPVEWTCSGGLYADGETCNCGCGTVDTDCYDTGLPITGCGEGEACLPDGQCVDAPENDTCATSLELSEGQTTGTTTGAANDYSHVRDAGGCINVEEDGPDVVYRVELSEGQHLTVTGQAASSNIALYLIGPGDDSVCDASSSACVAGVEETEYGEAETLEYTAEESGTYYLVVDSFFSGFYGDFELDTQVE